MGHVTSPTLTDAGPLWKHLKRCQNIMWKDIVNTLLHGKYLYNPIFQLIFGSFMFWYDHVHYNLNNIQIILSYIN